MKTTFQKSQVITLSLGHFFHDVYTSFLAPLLPLLIEKLGISLSLVGLLDIVRKVPSLFNPLIGVVADRICVKYLIILMPGVSCIAMSLLGLAPSYTVLLILLFVSGISASLFHVPAPVAIKRVSGDSTGRGMSYYMFGGELARSLGPLLVMTAVGWWGLEGIYKLMPLGIAASVLLYVKLRNVSDIVSAKEKPTHQKIERREMKMLVPIFTVAGLYILFRAGVRAALTLYLPIFLTQNGESLWLAGISLSIFQLAGAGGTFWAGSLSDRIGKRKTLLIAAILTPVMMGAFLLSQSWLAIVILIIEGMLIFAQGPVLLALFQDQKTSRPAFVNSIYMTINFGVNSLLVLFVGISGDAVGLTTTFLIAGILSVLAIPVVFFLPKEKQTTTD